MGLHGAAKGTEGKNVGLGSAQKQSLTKSFLLGPPPASGVAVRPPPLWWAPLILHTLALPLRPLAYTNLCTVAAGFVPPSPNPCSLAFPPPLGLPSAPFPRDGGQGVEPVCMQSVGSVQPAQVFFLKVRRQQSSKSVGRCSILGEGTGRYGGNKNWQARPSQGRVELGQVRQGSGYRPNPDQT